MARDKKSLTMPLLLLGIGLALVIMVGGGSIAAQSAIMGNAVQTAIANGRPLPPGGQVQLDGVPYLITAQGVTVDQCDVTAPGGEELDVAILVAPEAVRPDERLAVARFDPQQAGNYTIDCETSADTAQQLEITEVPGVNDDAALPAVVIGLIGLIAGVIIGAIGLLKLLAALRARRSWGY